MPGRNCSGMLVATEGKYLACVAASSRGRGLILTPPCSVAGEANSPAAPLVSHSVAAPSGLEECSASMSEAKPSTVVLGIGNLMRSDDGVGMHAVSRLARDPRLPNGIRVVEGGTQGLELVYHVQDSRCLLVLDSIDASEEPGTVMRFSGEVVSQMPPNKSAHLLSLVDLLEALKILGSSPTKSCCWACSPSQPAGALPSAPPWNRLLTSSSSRPSCSFRCGQAPPPSR